MSDTPNPQVRFSTSKGILDIELFASEAPVTVENFLNYVDSGFFNGTIFHRVIPGFMAQGGGFTPDMQQKKTGANIRNEADNGLKNERGTLAMARTPDPHSASSQFFINYKDNDFLNYQDSANYGYCVFGKVVDGMDTVDLMAKEPTTTRGPHGDVPQTPIIINSAARLDA